ncbi:LAMI_0H12464g1_1 [Lachancea mirantina]|uniref:LAMI_0H12464g1_1 n=1 Tax=Lachancea mirantina TaxID=1230905 RepID=A0A1G4KHK8_9SACH|nr:LAMI_0H12464g1_1 [Lachancea mirantina]
MEFFYEEQATSNGPESSKNHDDKTDEAFRLLESEIDAGYNRTTTVLRKFMDDSKDIELKLPIDEELSNKTQEVLGKLDTKLQGVENMAQSYWKRVSSGPFWSSLTQQADKLNDISAKDSEGGNVTLKSATLAANRTEAELKSLSVDASIYLEGNVKVPESWNPDEKTSEIAALLEKEDELRALMNRIVPEKISYRDFWGIYMLRRNQILNTERKRKEILNHSTSEVQEVDWDDEDETGNDDETQNKQAKTKMEAAENVAADDDADEDDDWE